MPRTRRKNGGWPTPRAGALDITCPAPSSIPGYPFTLTLKGAWEELPAPSPHHSPKAAVTDHALTIARNITSTRAPTDTIPAAARINTLLGRPIDVPDIPVRLTWAHVHLTATPDALGATTRHQRRLHEEEQRRAERNRRLDEAQTLRDTLMSDPSYALAYWFTTAPQTIDKDTITRLEQLHSAAAAHAPQGRWAPLARMLHTFADRLPDDARTHLIDTLAALTDRYGDPDIAAAIRTLQPIPLGDSRPH
ncbi:hypothetical protein ABTZ59_33455 [Streptomyces sp. NPDC094034]|uniref:hypothetical protein n=1 Tax=Streptomyces sp. NPDC094034 TaxID=3155309 RepID=UPI0033206C64